MGVIPTKETILAEQVAQRDEADTTENMADDRQSIVLRYNSNNGIIARALDNKRGHKCRPNMSKFQA